MLSQTVTTSLIATFLGLLLASCTCEGVPSGFWKLPPNQQDSEFEKYDFDTQYKIYICGNQRVEPPMLHLDTPFAREGQSIVQPLTAKLKATDRDEDVRDILRVFRRMSELGSYDVASNKPLVSLLREKAHGVRNPTWRQICDEDLTVIEKRSVKGSSH